MQNTDLLELYTLGDLTIQWRTKAEALILSPREALLLVYLAYQRVPMDRAHLCHLFWPDETPPRAHGNLRKLLVDLRKSLGDLLVITREELALHPKLNYWLDVHEFQWQMQPLEQTTKTTKESQESDASRLQRGVQLYGGTFLGKIKQPKSRAFCAWLEQEQARLQQQVVNALQFLIEVSKKQQHYGEAMHYAKRILELDPFDEDAHEQTMLLWAQMGCRDEAIQHYQAYCHLLKKELATTPEAQLLRLYQEIRAGISPLIAKERQEQPVQLQWNSHRPRQPLTKPLTPLLGRAESLAQLQQVLTDPAVRLVTLVGMGGIGKTHLALTLAEQLTLYFDNTIVLVSLHDLAWEHGAQINGQGDRAEEEEIAAGEQQQTKALHTLALTTAAALQIPIIMSESLMPQISKYLQEKQQLLIFDGFERLGSGATFLTTLLQAAPLLKVLVTSRECLQLPGETVVYLEGLPLPTVKDAAFFIQDQQVGQERERSKTVQQHEGQGELAPSLQLFTQCLQRQTPRNALHHDCLQNIIQICHLVEGNPLAIELAAGLSSHYSWREVANRLQHDFDILSTTQRGRAPRHRSMTTVIGDSWQQLSPAEQATLTGLGVFTDTFTRTAALAVTASSPEILMALVNKALVRSKGAGQYELPRLVRLFVTQILNTVGNEAQKVRLQAIHAGYYLSYFQQEMEHRQALAGTSMTSLLQCELGNLLNACTWVHRHGSPQQRQQYVTILATLRRWSATPPPEYRQFPDLAPY